MTYEEYKKKKNRGNISVSSGDIMTYEEYKKSLGDDYAPLDTSRATDWTKRYHGLMNEARSGTVGDDFRGRVDSLLDEYYGLQEIGQMTYRNFGSYGNELLNLRNSLGAGNGNIGDLAPVKSSYFSPVTSMVDSSRMDSVMAGLPKEVAPVKSTVQTGGMSVLDAKKNQDWTSVLINGGGIGDGFKATTMPYPVEKPLTQQQKAKYWTDWIAGNINAGTTTVTTSLGNTLDATVGNILKGVGWENNPVSKLNEGLQRDREMVLEVRDNAAEKLGLGKWADYVGSFTEGVVAAVPMALETMYTAGTNLVPTVANLADDAVMATGTLLQKLGLTTSNMMKNPQFWMSFVQSYGNEYYDAKESGASEVAAVLTATAKSLINSGIEIGIDGGSGMQGLMDDVAKGGKKLLSWIESAIEEGMEEVAQGFIGRLIDKFALGKDVKVLDPWTSVQEFGWGTAIGGFLSGGQVLVSDIEARADAKARENYLTDNEAKVVSKEVEKRVAKLEEAGTKVSKKDAAKIEKEVRSDLERGFISTDTIEEVLGGETYQSYQNATNEIKQIEDQLKELENAPNTVGNSKKFETLQTRLEELKNNSSRDQLKSKLSEEVKGLVQGSRLMESYNEVGRHKQRLEVDLSQYKNPNARATAENLSKVFDNSNKAHDVLDLMTKIAEETGVTITDADAQAFEGTTIGIKRVKQFTADGSATQYDIGSTNLNTEFKPIVKVNNKVVDNYSIDYKTGKITFDTAPSGEVSVEFRKDARINAKVGGNQIVIDMKSKKYLESLVGHEVTHVLENLENKKLYEALQNSIFEYARSKGEYDSRLKKLQDLYNGIEGVDVNAELTAELVGDYLFQDSDFISKLSTENRNVFQKVYDEIKHLLKLATAGSDQARKLEQVKYKFDQVYRELGKAQKNTAESGVKYSLNSNAKTELHKALYDKSYDSEVLLRDETPAIMTSQKGVKNLPMAMNAAHIRENVFTEEEAKNLGLKVDASKHYHGLGEEFFLNVVDGLDNVKEAYRGTKYADNPSRRENYFLLVSEFTDQNGDIVNVPVYIDEHAQVNRVFVDVNKISTVYGKRNFREYINRQVQQKNLVRIKNRSTQTSEHNAPIALRYGEDASSTDIVEENTGKVKEHFSLSDSDGRELSPGVSKQFANSKAVDENGNLKVLYHGTASGEFTIFDKAKGSVEGDFGSGFYFTDNESDVSEHYEGGGPDFDNKVARLAERIESEEDIDYEEAEKRAREELFKGSHKFEVYLNIENPAVVGETMLFDGESYLEQYNEEDYDDYDDYIADVEQALADDIENIVWEVEKNVDVYSTEGLAEVLYEAYYEGGIGIEELKSKINDLYLEDNEGNLVGNEVTRQIIESLGYDGIIDPTVSGKWNMNMEEGTTHYIVFKPNQIKAITNQNPTDNPDIHRSISEASEAPKKYGDRATLGSEITFVPEETVEDIAPVAENAALVAENDTIANEIAPETVVNAPERADDTAPLPPGSKRRKWVGTSTASEVVDGQVAPEDLDQDLIHYQPISNKKTLGNANAMLDSKGYEASVAYMSQRFAANRVSLDDIALGERLIQEAVKRGDTKTAQDLIMDISILGTELGQKVQALSIIKRLTPEGQLKMLMKVVERGKANGDKAFNGVEVTQEQADKILKTRKADGTYDQAELNKAVEDVKQEIANNMSVSMLEVVNEWRYLAMLGNPKTHIRNLVSNAAMLATRQVKNAIARTAEDVAGVVGKDIHRTKTWKAASQYVRDYANQVTEEEYAGTTGNKYSEAGDIKSKRNVLGNNVFGAASKANSASLTAEDTWFSKPAFRESFREYLTANGIRTEADVKKNGRIVAEAKAYATQQAKEATFQQDSYVASKINEIEGKNPLFNMAIGAVLPFKKTPINIAKTGLAYSPLGIARNIYDTVKVAKGEMEVSEAIDHVAQTLTGTSLALIGYALASNGILNGAGGDDKEDKYDYQLGKQSYSLNFDGDTFSLSWLSPVAMPLFVGANAYEQLVEDQEWDYNVVMEALAQTLDPLNEMSFLSSLSDVLSSYESGMAAFGGMMETAAQSYATSFVPTLSSQIAQISDDKKRSTKISANSSADFLEETWNAIKYKVPGLRQTLEPATDIWGNEIPLTDDAVTKALETFIAPYARKEGIATNVDAEIKNIYRLTGNDGVIPNIPGNSVNYKNEKYDMSAAEYTQFKKDYGQTAYGLMEALIQTDTYQRASADDKAKWMDEVFSYAMDEAKKNYLAKQGVSYTNSTKDGVPYYRENAIKGAVENDMTPEEYKLYRDDPEKFAMAEAVGGLKVYDQYKDATKDMKLGEKADYISGMNLSTEQKNLLINSETDRKEPIDLTGIEDYSSFEEFEFAKKYPGKYAMAKAVGGYDSYIVYADALGDIETDKDKWGQSIKNSRTPKVYAYIYSLDIPEIEKHILFKSEYNSFDDHNIEIIEYLNNRDDISYDEMVSLLLDLGFKVSADGMVRW